MVDFTEALLYNLTIQGYEMKVVITKNKVIISLCIIGNVLFNLFILYPKNYSVIENKKQIKNKSSNMLSLMLETKSGSGEYEIYTSKVWPQEGYVFNEERSGCENGSELAWDDTNKKVLVKTNKSDKCYVYFDKGPDTLANYIIGLYTTQGTNNLYHHDGTITARIAENGIAVGDAIDSGDGSYRYAGGDYTIATIYQETYKRITKKETTDTDALLGFMCGTEEKLPGVICNEETQYFYLTYEASESKTQYITYKEALNKLITDGYLLETPVKNYVCFGSDEDICPYDNLYRIIGVIDGRVKLIKADFASKILLGSDGDAYSDSSTLSKLYNGNLTNVVDTFRWNYKNISLASAETGYSNAWSYSELNKTNLNKNFLNNIGTKWSDKIASTTYYVSGTSSSGTAKNIYNTEVGTSKLTTFDPYKAKVGLMYVHDYLYGAYPSAWTTISSSYKIVRDNNWLFLGGWSEWTISPHNLNQGNAVFLTFMGVVSNYNIDIFKYGVRPSFSLLPSVTFAGGSGTSTDPYRIN